MEQQRFPVEDGAVTCRPVGDRLEVQAALPGPGEGLYRAYLRGESGKQLDLGTLLPQGNGRRLQRSLPIAELKRRGCGPVTGAGVTLSYAFERPQGMNQPSKRRRGFPTPRCWPRRCGRRGRVCSASGRMGRFAWRGGGSRGRRFLCRRCFASGRWRRWGDGCVWSGRFRGRGGRYNPSVSFAASSPFRGAIQKVSTSPVLSCLARAPKTSFRI